MIVPLCENCTQALAPLEEKPVGFIIVPRRCIGCGSVHRVHAHNDQIAMRAIERTRAQLQSLGAAVSIYVEASEQAHGNG